VRAGLGLAPDPGLEMLHRDLVLVPCPPTFRDPEFLLPDTARAIRPGVLEPRPVGASDSRPDVDVTVARSSTPRWGRSSTWSQGTCSSDRRWTGRPGRRRGRHPRSSARSVDVGPGAEQRAPRTVRPPGDRAGRRRRWCRTADRQRDRALAFGVPSVLLPIGADQTRNGQRCRELGVESCSIPWRRRATTCRSGRHGAGRHPDAGAGRTHRGGSSGAARMPHLPWRCSRRSSADHHPGSHRPAGPGRGVGYLAGCNWPSC
jgi:hypothetical protein